MNPVAAVILSTIVIAGFIYLKFRFPTIFLTPSDEESDLGVKFSLYKHASDIAAIPEKEKYFFRTLSNDQKNEFIRRVIVFNHTTRFLRKEALNSNFGI